MVPHIGLRAEDLLGSRDEAVYVTELHLYVTEVPANPEICRVDAHGLPVALGRLLIVSVVPVEEPVDVPAGVRLDVSTDSCLGKVMGLLPAIRVVGNNEALESERLPVMWMLFQNLQRSLRLGCGGASAQLELRQG